MTRSTQIQGVINRMPIRAYIHMTTNPGSARDVAAAISKIDGVTSADLTTGRYDVVVLVEKDDADLAWLQNIVLTKIRREHVIRTETMISTEKFTRSR
jgi:DNA-binding Lrp family transcriptional regulator